MAAAFNAPNLRRFDVPESSSFPWTGVMRDLDDLVERVMAVHMKKSGSFDPDSIEEQQLVA